MPSSERIIERVKEIVPWTVPAKLVLSSLLGMFGGAGLLGYLSEYATYNYAIYFGIRPPLEGIPYLRPAVAFGSLFLLLSGAVVFVGIVFVLRFFAWYIDAIPRLSTLPLRLLGRDTQRHERHYGQLLTLIRARPPWQQILGCLLFAALMAALMHTFVLTMVYQLRAISPHIATSFLYFFAIGLAVVKPASTWWTAIVVTISYFVVCIYLLFSPLKYSQLLRILGYGGGLSVQIELRDSSGSIGFDGANQQLMLRTNEAVILYDQRTGKFSEIPREQVHRIVHDIGGMRRLPYALPDRVNKWGDG
jgi:hypothetical protein